MATKKTKNIKTKKPTKPEVVFTALPHKVAPPKPKPKRSPKRSYKKPQPTKKDLRMRTRMIKRGLGALIVIIIFIAIGYATTSTFRVSNILDTALNKTGDINTSTKESVKRASIAGSDTKLINQVVNYQSAPQDLQAFVIQDYRKFKNNCIVNGQISPDAGYQIISVVYDKFAKVGRTCGGTSTALIKKFDSGWTEVFSGNIPPSCSMVNDLQIPKGLAETCTDNGATYTNPNP